MRAAFKALTASECWDWLTPVELQRLTSQAYHLARKNSRAPKGESQVNWSSPEAFSETLCQLVVLHIQAHAHAAGIPNCEYAPGQLSRWYLAEQAPGQGVAS